MLKTTRYSLFTMLFLLTVNLSVAQEEEAPKHQGRHLPVDTMVTTQHEVTIKGEEISYTAIAGTQPVYAEDGHVIASLFYVYYKRNGIDDRSSRPLMISFNGGPGTGSVWMNIGFTGPKRLSIDSEGFPVEPYGVADNPHSVLDMADIVYVCPVNTGFSRIIDHEVDESKFFGVNADVRYLSGWINTFVNRHNRWQSPKFLIGESYGTTRVSGLAKVLQQRQWMYLDGVILVSPTDLGIDRSGPVKEASFLPYYAATAWYHNALSSDLQERELKDLLQQVESFTINEYIPALVRGGSLDDAKRQEIAKKVALYSGISKREVLNHNLIIPRNFYWKDLLRERGYTVGRLDSRYIGIDQQIAGTRPDYNAELNSWLHSFTPAVNYYLREELNFHTDLKYQMFGDVWPWKRDRNNTGRQLQEAMLGNPNLHLMVLSGYYDGACDYFNAKYSIWQINQNGRLDDRIEWHGYKSGHMMYLRDEDNKAANNAIRNFIKEAIPSQGESIRYHLPKERF